MVSTSKIKLLKKQLKNAVNEIIKAFEEKQEMNFEFFVDDDITGIACFGDVLYLNISDIWYDLLTEQPKGLIIDWIYDCLENENKTINYRSYSMGLRFKALKNNKVKIEVNKSTIENNKSELLLCEAKDYLENRCYQ